MRERIQRFDARQNMLRQNYEIFHYSTQNPEPVEVHHHDFYEVYFFLGGDVSYWVEGQNFRMSAGDVLLIDPMVLHRPVILSDATAYERIVLWIDRTYLEGLSRAQVRLNGCFQGNGANLLHITAPVQRTDLTALFGRLVRECYGEELGASICADGVFMQLMVELNRIALQSGQVPASQRDQSSAVARVLDYINAHYSEELSLDALADRFFISKYHLSHEFSRVVGTGVYRYIMLKRLAAAKLLLAENVPAGEVCSRCGFRDYTGFFRAFKAEFGVSPGAFQGSRSPF